MSHTIDTIDVIMHSIRNQSLLIIYTCTDTGNVIRHQYITSFCFWGKESFFHHMISKAVFPVVSNKRESEKKDQKEERKQFLI